MQSLLISLCFADGVPGGWSLLVSAGESRAVLLARRAELARTLQPTGDIVRGDTELLTTPPPCNAVIASKAGGVPALGTAAAAGRAQTGMGMLLTGLCSLPSWSPGDALLPPGTPACPQRVSKPPLE